MVVPYNPRIPLLGYPRCSHVVPSRVRIARLLRGFTHLAIYQRSFVCRALGNDSHDRQQHEELKKRMRTMKKRDGLKTGKIRSGVLWPSEDIN